MCGVNELDDFVCEFANVKDKYLLLYSRCAGSTVIINDVVGWTAACKCLCAFCSQSGDTMPCQKRMDEHAEGWTYILGQGGCSMVSECAMSG